MRYIVVHNEWSDTFDVMDLNNTDWALPPVGQYTLEEHAQAAADRLNEETE